MSQSTEVKLVMPMESCEFYSGSRVLGLSLNVALNTEKVIKDLNIRPYIIDNMNHFIKCIGLTKTKFIMDMVEHYEEFYCMHEEGEHDYDPSKPACVLSLTIHHYG